MIDGAQNNLNVVRSAKGSSPFARDIAHAKPPRRTLWNASLRSDNSQRDAMPPCCMFWYRPVRHKWP